MNLVVTKVARKGQTVFGVEYEIRDDSNNLLAFNFVHLTPEGSNATQRRANAIAFAQEWLPDRCAIWALTDPANYSQLAESRVGERMLLANGWIALTNVTYSVAFTPATAEVWRTYRVPRAMTLAEQVAYLTAKHANDTATMDAIKATCLAEGTNAYRWVL